MNLSNLTKIVENRKKRLGRGTGSGKGKTSARGTKGQKARGKIPVGFIGGTLPIYKKLPFNRGLGNPKRSPKAVAISLSKLANLKENSEVTIETLVNLRLISPLEGKARGVKLTLGDLKNSLIIKLPISKQAKLAVEKAGGKVVNG